MRVISSFRRFEWTLKRKLFVYMLILTFLLLAILTVGLILFGRTNSINDSFHESLDMQMEVFEKDVTTHFDHLAASAISLSEDMTAILEETLRRNNLSLSSLTDSGDAIVELQEIMLESLRHKLFQADASGVFVMLNATVNSTLPDAENSATGIYLKTNGYDPSASDVLMYRGAADIAKKHGIMPHRKWRLEFRTDLFPDYEDLAKESSLPLEASYRITDLFSLPGTSENVLLLMLPIMGEDGMFYGVCGYEISESYFMTHHAQPSKLPHLSCVLTKEHDNQLLISEALTCGSSDGYFNSFTNDYSISRSDGKLTRFTDDVFSYLGIEKSVVLAPGEEHLLTVMIPKSDYDYAWYKSVLQTGVLVVLLAFFAVNFSRYFSKRFLSPILKALDQIKSDEREAASTIPEIVDLIDYLAKQEKEHGETLNALEMRNREAENEKIRLQTEYENALNLFRKVEEEYTKAQDELMNIQGKLDRLAYSRKTEIDPDDYQNFLSGLQTLTESEKKIFEYYLSGKSAKEILDITGIKESTLKYHNHNLLGKLGVSSRKQMLRYAELMRHQGEDH